MLDSNNSGRRRGGRLARQALRERTRKGGEEAGPRPVTPGLEGGRYLPLDEDDLPRIHGAALKLLAEVGLADALPSCTEVVCAAGGSLSAQGRLLFPPALVEETLAKAARHFTLHALDPRHDMEPWGRRVYFGTAGAAVEMVDAFTHSYRMSTLADLHHIARLVDTLEHIHFFQRPIVLCDMADQRELDLNTCYAAVVGTGKHVGTSFFQPEHVEETLAMLHLMAGGEEAWRARPFVSMSCCFVVPPLKFAADACRCLEVGVRGGMPILLLSAGQAGATSPAALAGAVVQAVAEVLAGLVYVNLLVPGHPCIFGAWPFVSDLRSGAMSGGSGEQAILAAAIAQMARYYDLTGGIPAGMTDSKLPDVQSGYEKGVTLALAGQAGGNMIYEAAGMHASLLGFCLESCVIDNDIIGMVQRSLRGIEVSEENLSVGPVREVCIDGPGHFLGHEQTLTLMERDYLYPEIGDRLSPKAWKEAGAPSIVARAREKVEEVLARHYPRHVDAALDAAVRARFPVRLPAEALGPKPGR